MTTTTGSAPAPGLNDLSPEAIIARVEPVVRRYAAAAESGRQLAPEAMTALIDAGVFRGWVPRALGG